MIVQKIARTFGGDFELKFYACVQLWDNQSENSCNYSHGGGGGGGGGGLGGTAHVGRGGGTFWKCRNCVCTVIKNS